MRVWTRSIFFVVVFYAYTIVSLLILTPLSLVMPRRALLASARVWARSSLALLKWICHLSVDIRGLERLPRGPFILAMKHQSLLETLVLMAILRDPAFIMKRELAFVPLWGWVAWRAGAIFVTRGRGRTALNAMTEGAVRAVDRGQSVVIAPEGTRTPPGAEPAYKYGVAHLYARLDVPILPMALNTGLFWPHRGIRRWPGLAVISFGEPIAPGLTPEALLGVLRDTIESECDTLLIEGARQRGLETPARTHRRPVEPG